MKRKIKSISCLLSLFFILFFNGCSDDTNNNLAPYTENRAFEILRVTKSMNPDIQWLGGRVAAVGVNPGNKAALDSSLIYLRTAEDNSIGSYVTFPSEVNLDMILQFGGTYKDSLNDETEYTFWLAEKSAIDAELDSVQLNEFNFIDTTLVMSIFLKGKAGGEKDAQGNYIVIISITRDEKMLTDNYYINWEPSNIPFRQMAIRKNSLGGFTDLLWHVVTPDSLEDNIYPPVTIGITPEGAEEAVPWSDTKFEDDKVHILWMSNSDWTVNNFSPTATGYAWYRIYPFD